MSAVRPIQNSTGLAIAQRPDEGNPGDNDFSFRVKSNGEVVDLGGWGYAGPLPGFRSMINVPPNPLAVHTVAVDDDGARTRRGLRELIDQHLEDYGECQVYLGQGTGHELVNWSMIGCPGERDAPSDDELAEMYSTEILTADEHFYEASEPNPALAEHDAGSIPGALEVEKEMAASARAAAGASHPTAQATGVADRAAEAKARARERAEDKTAEPAPKATAERAERASKATTKPSASKGTATPPAAGGKS